MSTVTTVRRDSDRQPTLRICECTHAGPGPDRPCGKEAVFRVTAICTKPGCDHAAAVHLLCAACTRSWQDQAAADPAAPALRIRRL